MPKEQSRARAGGELEVHSGNGSASVPPSTGPRCQRRESKGQQDSVGLRARASRSASSPTASCAEAPRHLRRRLSATVAFARCEGERGRASELTFEGTHLRAASLAQPARPCRMQRTGGARRIGSPGSKGAAAYLGGRIAVPVVVVVLSGANKDEQKTTSTQTCVCALTQPMWAWQLCRKRSV